MDMIQQIGQGFSTPQQTQLNLIKNKHLQEYEMPLKKIPTELQILREYKIGLTGSFEYGNHNFVSRLIREQGGEIYPKTKIEEINLLIVGSKTKTTSKFIQKMIESDISVVNENWLLSSIKQQQIADLMLYAWQSKYIHIISC